MSDEKPPLTDAIRHLAEQDRRSLSDHPSPATLAAYYAGELSPEAEAGLREHLALCRHCSDLLLDLAGFADLAPPPGVAELTDAEVEADWRALQERMGEKAAEVVPFRPAAKTEAKAPYRPPFWVSIAASLLAVAGLSFGIYERGELQKSQQEKAGADFVNDTIPLYTGSTRGPDNEEKVMSSQDGGYLDLDAGKTFDRYDAEFISGETVVLSLKSGKEPRIHVHGGTLKPGEYQIRLFGIVNGNREPAGEFALQVKAP